MARKIPFVALGVAAILLLSTGPVMGATWWHHRHPHPAPTSAAPSPSRTTLPPASPSPSKSTPPPSTLPSPSKSTPPPSTTAPAGSGFVTRSGKTLSEQFVGFNAFGAASACDEGGKSWTTTQMNDYFAQLPANGLTRTWVFPGENLNDVDRLVSSATAHGQHLDLVLDNDLADCTSTGQKSNSFYQSGYKNTYLPWAKTVATRYKASTAVALYEMINEAGQSHGDGYLNGSTMQSFYETTAAAIKSVDPNHLVGTGDAAEYLYSNGATGYKTAASGSHVDVLSLHDYESDWISNPPAMSTHWQPCKSAADALNKPILVGEINDGLSHYSGSQARANGVTASMRDYLNAGAAGALVWNYTYTAGDYDPDYSIRPGDPMVTAVRNLG